MQPQSPLLESTAGVPSELLKDSYDRMFYQALRIRLVEEKIIELYPSDKIQSPVHLSIGQEAIAVGACASLNTKDLLFCNYRSHAFYLAKGGSMKEMMAELYGKIDGCGRGKAGSMHLLAPEVGLMQASAVVAASVPQAVGAAMTYKQLKKPGIIVAVFGDGATEQGVIHEAFNFAALQKLPIVFLCENNEFAVHSRLEARQAYRISDLPKTYKIPTTICEKGYSLTDVQESFAKVVEKTRANRTPWFIEIQAYRYKEHVGPGDDFDAGYRSREDLNKWKALDPLLKDEARVERYKPFIRKEIDEAVAFAEASPFPGKDELLRHVI